MCNEEDTSFPRSEAYSNDIWRAHVDLSYAGVVELPSPPTDIAYIKS